MLRVLTLSTLFPNPAQPGLGTFVARQTQRLASRPDVDLRVIAPLGLPPAPLDRLARYTAIRNVAPLDRTDGLTVARPRFRLLPGLSGAINPWLIYRAARPVLRQWLAAGFACDVIDAEFFYPDGPAAALLAREFKIPFSIKARGSDIHLWRDKAGCRAQMLGAAEAAGGLLAVSEAMKRDMVALGMEAAKIRVHYTGVDLNRFRPLDRAAAKAGLGASGPLVASVGNLIPLKGHALVIEAVGKLPGVTLLIAGDGPLRGELGALIARLGLQGRVRLLGAISHDAIPALLGAADILAHASEREGLANVWVEALACGTPVVVPDIGSAREVIDRPSAGRVIDARTPEAIAAAVRDLLAAPPAPDSVRLSAERFHWDRNSEALHAHLRALI